MTDDLLGRGRRRSLALLGPVSSVALSLLASSGCGDAAEPPAPAASSAPSADAPRVAWLSPTEHLVRASMALRGGLRPSVEDLRAVAADPSRLEAIVDRYLASPELGPMIRDLHDEALRVKVAGATFPAAFPARGALAAVDAQTINESVTDAPLRLIQHVVESDRPYSEIVTAGYAYADRISATVWGLPYEGDGEGWRETRYEDGREHAGILSDSFLFTRHSTTFSNANRGRANAISSALLCYDFLSRDIDVDATINLADPAEVANASKNNATCASCHQTLDPLASYFAGFRPQFAPSFEQRYPLVFAIEPLAGVYSRAEPAYFGRQGRGLAYLGATIAADPRFSLCTAKRFYAYLHQVPLERVPVERAAALQSELVASGMSAKRLLRSIVLADDFRASHALDDAAPESAAPGLRKIRPRELARMFDDLTGLRWETELGDLAPGSPFSPGRIGRVDLLTDPFFGYAVLFGGADDFYVTRPSHTMNATAVAVLRAVASKAAARVVASDLAQPDRARRRLMGRVSADETDPVAIRAQLVDLHARLYGELVDASDRSVEESYALFRDALERAPGDVARAWTVTLYAMLQDLRLAFY